MNGNLQSNNAAVINTKEILHTMRDAMKKNIQVVQDRIYKYYNKKVAKEEQNCKDGDWVMVNTKNVKTKCSTKKLDYKLRGKFQI